MRRAKSAAEAAGTPKKGIKSCAECAFPHRRENYDKAIEQYGDIMKVVQKMDREEV